MISRRDMVASALFGAAYLASPRSPSAAAGPAVDRLRITILSTMVADAGFGEWGFSALVDAGGRQILFDTGAHPDTVLKNAQELKIDLSTVETVVLSHNHDDHTSGLITLRRELMKANPNALSVAHAGEGIFTPRIYDDGEDGRFMLGVRDTYEALGGRWVIHDKPAELLPGIWFTGPVPRPNDERNWSGSGRLVDEKTGRPGAEDTIPEDSSLIFDTPKGLVLLTGCGHAGVVNIAQYAGKIVRPVPFDAVVGGIHLFEATDQKIAWTAAKLKAIGVRHLLAAHCTGIEATYLLRHELGLTRATAAVGAVGSWYDLAVGIHPGSFAG